MKRERFFHLTIVAGLVVSSCVLLFFSSGLVGRPNPAPAVGAKRHHGMRKIKHIVFIVKENRTFDNYFGTFPGVDGATMGTISTGDVIPLGRAPDTLPRDISHSFQSAVTAIHGGLVAMRRRSGNNWIRIDDMAVSGARPFGNIVLQTFANRDFLQAHATDEQLLAVKPKMSPDAQLGVPIARTLGNTISVTTMGRIMASGTLPGAPPTRILIGRSG